MYVHKYVRKYIDIYNMYIEILGVRSQNICISFHSQGQNNITMKNSY